MRKVNGIEIGDPMPREQFEEYKKQPRKMES